MRYLFDTNIFIRSKNEMPPEIWPTFWTRIAELIREGKIFSSEKVRDEINKGNDELTEWMKENVTKDFYIPIDEGIIAKYASTQNWAMTNPIFTLRAKEEYARVADAYLVATAAAKDMVLVTYEVSDPTCKKRVKIPDACLALDVSYCDLNYVFRKFDVKI